jgi:hypothetical protein
MRSISPVMQVAVLVHAIIFIASRQYLLSLGSMDVGNAEYIAACLPGIVHSSLGIVLYILVIRENRMSLCLDLLYT